MQRLARDAVKIMAHANQGGLGFPRERIRLDGLFDVEAVPEKTPSLMQPTLAELAAAGKRRRRLRWRRCT